MNITKIVLAYLLSNNLVSSQVQNISAQVQPKLRFTESDIMYFKRKLQPESFQRATTRALEDVTQTKANIQEQIQQSQQSQEQLQTLQKELENALRLEELLTNFAKEYNTVEEQIVEQNPSIISGRAISHEKLNQQKRIMREYESKGSGYTREL